VFIAAEPRVAPDGARKKNRKARLMLPLILVLLLVLVLFGVGFAVKALWIVAGILLVAWLLGFVFRSPAGTGGGRWYRW
jgi:1,4-dihydroxy-2-naphthoate octaprenyltransferase